MSSKINLPKLNKGQFSLFLAEKSTGILLKLDDTRHLGEGDFYAVFNSIEEAEVFARNAMATKQGVECWIRDEEGEAVRTLRE